MGDIHYTCIVTGAQTLHTKPGTPVCVCVCGGGGYPFEAGALTFISVTQSGSTIIDSRFRCVSRYACIIKSTLKAFLITKALLGP